MKANIINKFSLLDHNSHFFLEEKIFKNKEIFEKMFDSLEKEKSKNKLLQPRELKDIDSWELFQ